MFRYAIATGRAERDPTADLRGVLKPVQTEHRGAITEPARVGGAAAGNRRLCGGSVVPIRRHASK